MKGPLRFCMVTTFYPPYSFGGDGVFVHRLANELGRRGHEVEVVHCIDSYRALSGNEPQATWPNHPNVTVHGLRSRWGVLSPLATQQSGRPVFKSKALRGILSKQFDVIHYHNISLVGGPRVLEYGEAIKLYTMHEYWLVCPTHVLFKYNREPCQSRQCFLCSLTYRRPPQWWRHTGLLERAVRHVDAFIAPARFSGEIQRKMGLDVPIVHLPPFVGTSEASSSPEAPSSARPYFLYAGRLERLKGVQTLIPIFKRYRKAELVIAGGGSLEGELKREAEGCSNIRFVGVVDQQQLGSLYRGAVALIVPSICYEVFPLVIIEAFREGTPALVRNIGGMPEIIQESGGGAAFRTDEELIERMDSLLADPAAREEPGACGRQAYLQKWSADAHIPRYLDLISEIAARKPGYASLPACFSRREPT